MSAAELSVEVTPPKEPRARRLSPAVLLRVARGTVFWIAMYTAALAIFGLFAATRDVDPIAMYQAMWDATVTNSYGLGQVLSRAAPFILAALAVAVPARAGLINIGGEGQIVLGATAAGGVALALGGNGGTVPALVLMGLAGMAAGGAWAGLAAVLKVKGRVDEAISTLLLNFVAFQVLNYLIFGPWKDSAGNGQPASELLAADHKLPVIESLHTHVGIVIALVVTLGVGLLLWRTQWGFALRCVGGNQEAARRAGLPVGRLLITAMLVGGALAGLAGMIHYAGLEGQLRPGLAATFGYTAFLASWLARHQPGRVVVAAVALAAIAVAGDTLQISSNLPGAAVNVLMAVVLLVVLSHRRTPAKAA